MIKQLLIKLLKEDYQIFAPVKSGKNLLIKEIRNPQLVDYSAKTPENSWKKIFLPATENLFNFKKNKIKQFENLNKKTVAWGMNIIDLRALGLFDLVFSKDIYYQKRRKNILVIGFSTGAPDELKNWQIFSQNLEENILEHLPFDIFLEKTAQGKFRIYASSEKGIEALEKNNINNFEHIEFSGLIPEEGLNQKMLEQKEIMKKSKNKKTWKELGELCIACGKCSIVCPTCFCFDIYDEAINKDEFKRVRSWASCFYPEFSQISEGQQFLGTIAKKIYFWYEHKFIRIPGEYKIPGCVGCGRCGEVCPVGIKIKNTFNSLKNDK